MPSEFRIASLALSLALAGCANLNTAYRDFTVNDGSGAMVDIKQRAVIAAKRKSTDSDGRTIKSLVVCAEPSPDALSAFAAELAAEGGNGQVSATLAAATQESAAFVGLRTQSIQLLRDSFYRACEGYMSGALTQAQFDVLTRRHQRYMVALLGIEQLTGAVRAPTVTLTTEGQASAGQSLSTLRTQLEATEAQIASKQSEKDKADADSKDSAKTDAEKKAAADRAIELGKQIAELKKDKAALENGILQARGVTAGGSTAAYVSAVGVNDTRSDATLEKVAETVGRIVNTVLNTDELTELCLSALGVSPDDTGVARIALFGLSSKDEKDDPTGQKAFLGGECRTLLGKLVNAKQQEAIQRDALVAALTQKLGARTDYTPEQVKAMVDAFTAALTALRESS